MPGPKFAYAIYRSGEAREGIFAREFSREPEGTGYDLEIAIYDAIARGGDPFFGGTSARMVLEALRGNEGASVLVRLNSPGGDVTEGFDIYNLLTEHRGKVTTRVDGMAGSMASVLMLAGDERQMAFGGTVMIHNPFGIVEGEAGELRGIAGMLERQKTEMVSIYSKRTGLSAARVARMMDETTWLGAEEALDLGFATRITGTPARMVAAASPEDLKKAPPHIREQIRAQAREMLASLEEDSPTGAKGETPGRAAMTEEEMKAAVAKAVAEAKAAVDAIAAKDDEIAKLKGELEASQKAKAEFPPKDDDEEEAKAKNPFADDKAQAVIAAATELTGEKDPAKLEVALLALADSPKVNTSAAHAERVNKLVAEGKIPPARKARFLAGTAADVDQYLKLTGGMKMVPIGQEHKSDEEKARLEALNSDAVTLSRDDIAIARGMGMTPEKALELKKQQASNGFARTF